MAAKRLTDLEIAARIVPTMLRWPATEIAKSIAWDRLRECVDATRALVRTVDDGCFEAEQNHDLSPQGIARRRTELGRQGLTELQAYKPLQAAEKAVAADLGVLEKRMVDLPSPPASNAEVSMAREIRDYVSDQKSPIDFVVKNMSDARLLGAILHAPPYLSGLSPTEWNLTRERARAALHPEQIEMQALLTKALEEVRAGVDAARRLLMERCEMRRDDDGQFRSIREPLPGGALGTTKATAAKTTTAA